MLSRRACTRPTADAESGQPNQPMPPPEIPQREEASEETPRTGSEADISGANAGGGGNADRFRSYAFGGPRGSLGPHSGAEAAVAVSNSSTSSASTSASTHEGKTE